MRTLATSQRQRPRVAANAWLRTRDCGGTSQEAVGGGGRTGLDPETHYKRTSPHRPWRSRHRGLTLTGRGEACLREIHASILRKHLHRLEHPGVVEQDVESEKEDDNKLEDEMHEDEDDKRYSPEPIPQHTENQFEEEDGSFSPQLMHGNEDEDAIDPEEDKAELDRKREAVVLEHQRKVQEAMKAKARVTDEVFGAGAKVNLDSQFNIGVMPYLSSIPWVVTSFTHKKRDLATLVHPTAYELSWFLKAYACSICSQVYWWHDKYGPRKPKYFNRVHTGYEWNKYNQTHYDHDNPPPKIVQGYKFNIFYPDLVDKSKAPSYSYIGEFEYVDDHRAGKIVVELNGRLNKCGVISPRFDVGVKEIEEWTARLLPSRQHRILPEMKDGHCLPVITFALVDFKYDGNCFQKSKHLVKRVDPEMDGYPQEQSHLTNKWFSSKSSKKIHLTAVTSVIDGLKKLYIEKLKPLEVTYKFNDFVSPLLVEMECKVKQFTIG
ncbi:unnamed protein product [Miscanthus lutarioriparius]|uniref:Uncharacterized protein n=1 Tax=Miscanthus lutarioriparius TaxID=422564 RepID=A0A811QLV2_9POAL|nr:unnamed protein product [Miscanthus lutarioriparius]